MASPPTSGGPCSLQRRASTILSPHHHATSDASSSCRGSGRPGSRRSRRQEALVSSGPSTASSTRRSDAIPVGRHPAPLRLGPLATRAGGRQDRSKRSASWLECRARRSRREHPVREHRRVRPDAGTWSTSRTQSMTGRKTAVMSRPARPARRPGQPWNGMPAARSRSTSPAPAGRHRLRRVCRSGRRWSRSASRCVRRR